MADPWDEAFASYQQALVDLNGDGIPDAVIRMPQGQTMTTPPQAATGRDRRQIQRRAMAGLEPTEQQNALLRGAMPQLEENTNRLGNFGMELTGIPQVGRAGAAIGEAASEPSIANLTNAGAQTALAAFRPLVAGKVALGGLGAAAVSDAFTGDANAQAKRSNDRDRARAANAETKASAARAKAEADILRAQTEAERQAAELRKSEAERVTKKAEYDSAVQRADAAFETIKGERPRKFNETAVGQVYDKLGVIAPGVIGAGGAAIGRAFSGGGSAIKDYLAPMIVGAATGGVAANWPLAHELIFQPPGNTERKAYEAYARELPADHPRKQEMGDYARSLPIENPDRTAASAELYDPIKLAERTGLGAAEGLLGGLAGAHVVGLSERGASAARNALTKKRGGAEPPVEPPVPPPPQPVSYRTYPDLPQSARTSVQDAYLADRGIRGSDLPPREGAAAIKQSLAQQGINVPVTPQRVNATNEIMTEFVRQNGRLPTRQESNALFNRYTLAIPAAVGAGYAAEGPVNRLLQQYQGG